MWCQKQTWEKDIQDKSAVAHMYEDAEVFQSSILEARQLEFAEEVRVAEERAWLNHKQKKVGMEKLDWILFYAILIVCRIRVFCVSRIVFLFRISLLVYLRGS